MKNTEFIDEPAKLQYFESFFGSTTTPKRKRSPNNRADIYMSCEPIMYADSELREKIINFLSTCIDQDGKRTNQEWPKDIIACVPMNIIGMPNYESANFLLDRTEGSGIPANLRDFASTAFEEVMAYGPMTSSPIMGSVFYIDRIEIIPNPHNRPMGFPHVALPMQDLIRGLTLNSEPILQEPIYSFNISIPNELYSEFQKTLKSARVYIEEEEICGKDIKVNGFIPGAEITKIKGVLQSVSQAAEPVDIKISHYAIAPGSIDKDGSPMKEIINKIRNYIVMNTHGNPYPLNVHDYLDF
ncbi:MAG: hypothetical protein RLZZ597_1574 [Cyanobacteriota bacterium]|jgi:translation elongation factor EF-G